MSEPSFPSALQSGPDVKATPTLERGQEHSQLTLIPCPAACQQTPEAALPPWLQATLGVGLEQPFTRENRIPLLSEGQDEKLRALVLASPLAMPSSLWGKQKSPLRMELHFLKMETKRSKPWVQQLPPQRLPSFLGSLSNFLPYLPGKEEGS